MQRAAHGAREDPSDWHRTTARDRLKKVMDHGYAANFDSTVVHALQGKTLEGYHRQLQRLARAEQMRPGDGPWNILESRLLQVVQWEQSESTAKAVLWAARIVQKLGWVEPVVRKADWSIVHAVELQRSKEERAAAKEWAQTADLVRLCGAARTFSEWEAVALACVSVGHCLRRAEAGGPVGEGVRGGHVCWRQVQTGATGTGHGALGARMGPLPGKA